VAHLASIGGPEGALDGIALERVGFRPDRHDNDIGICGWTLETSQKISEAMAAIHS